MPAQFLLGHGAILQLASHQQTNIRRWSHTVKASEIQTSVMALAIARAQVEAQKQGKERQLWSDAIDQLERNITSYAGAPLPVTSQVASEWVSLRYEALQSTGPGGALKSTTQDVRLVLATAIAHGLTLVDDEPEPYHVQLRQWNCQVLVPP